MLMDGKVNVQPVLVHCSSAVIISDVQNNDLDMLLNFWHLGCYLFILNFFGW